MMMKYTSIFLLCTLCVVTADLNINFAQMFAHKPSGAVATDANPNASDDVNVNFAYMMDGYQGCEDDHTDCSSPHAIEFTAMTRDPYVATMPGLCRWTAEPGRQVACVRPAGTLDIQVTLQNTGTEVWSRKTVKLELDQHNPFYPYWPAATLLLDKNIEPHTNGTFRGVITAPNFPGVFDLQWFAESSCGRFGNVTTRVEVTCSDGIFCNGMERFVNGRCMTAPHEQCDDKVPCTVDTCDEETQMCAHKSGEGCTLCFAGNCTSTCFPGQECGYDGCGGVCGGYCAYNQGCVDGYCKTPSGPGTCSQPFQLIADGVPLIGRHIVETDNSKGVDEVTPTCNTESTATEIVFTFTIPEGLPAPVSIDARMMADDIDLDTLLELRKDRCQDAGPNDPEFITESFDPNVNAWCSDDATPPGNLFSRVAAELRPGTYYLIADGYSSITVGPVKLDVRFVSGYTPKCLSKYCGDDGGGGDCGPCDSGFACSTTLTCIPDPCVEQKCLNGTAVCGDDGCGRGGKCGPLNGECPPHPETGEKQWCVQVTGTCQTFPVCDHLRPVPFEPCGVNEYVGDDCKCHSMHAELPDLRIDRDAVTNSLYFDYVEFDQHSCAYKEQCVDGLGLRRVMRFDTIVVNQGNADLLIAEPRVHPHEFEFSPCHNHYHYKGFAEYRLLTPDGQHIIRRGHKQAYCLEDSGRHDTQEGPNISCKGASDCTYPGLLRGYFDVYGSDLDCQWIDITDLAPGTYLLRIDVNTERQLHESNHENNSVVVEVVIPPETAGLKVPRQP